MLIATASHHVFKDSKIVLVIPILSCPLVAGLKVEPRCRKICLNATGLANGKPVLSSFPSFHFYWRVRTSRI